MFTVESSLEVEDLFYCVTTRQQVVTQMLAEAEDMMNGALAAEMTHELNRLDILKDKIEQHIEDHDYRLDILCRLFPDMCTD